MSAEFSCTSRVNLDMTTKMDTVVTWGLRLILVPNGHFSRHGRGGAWSVCVCVCVCVVFQGLRLPLSHDLSL